MERYAHIPFIEDGVVFSDPWYGEDVWCQYRKSFLDYNWLMKMESTVDHESDCIEFTLSLGRPTMMGTTKINEGLGSSLTLSHLNYYDVSNMELGMDTAQIYCGSQKNWEQFKDSAALHTGTDGYFGDLMVFTCKGEDIPAGFVLMGSIDSAMVDEETLFAHMLSGFDGQEITKEAFAEKTDLTALSNKVLMSNELRTASRADSEPSQPGHDTPER